MLVWGVSDHLAYDWLLARAIHVCPACKRGAWCNLQFSHDPAVMQSCWRVMSTLYRMQAGPAVNVGRAASSVRVQLSHARLAYAHRTLSPSYVTAVQNSWATAPIPLARGFSSGVGDRVNSFFNGSWFQGPDTSGNDTAAVSSGSQTDSQDHAQTVALDKRVPNEKVINAYKNGRLGFGFSAGGLLFPYYGEPHNQQHMPPAFS